MGKAAYSGPSSPGGAESVVPSIRAAGSGPSDRGCSPSVDGHRCLRRRLILDDFSRYVEGRLGTAVGIGGVASYWPDIRGDSAAPSSLGYWEIAGPVGGASRIEAVALVHLAHPSNRKCSFTRNARPQLAQRPPPALKGGTSLVARTHMLLRR